MSECKYIGKCNSSRCLGCNPKRRRPGESREEWLLRIGFEPVSEEQKRINLENNLDWFLS